MLGCFSSAFAEVRSYARVEQLLEPQLEIDKRVSDPEDLETLMTMNNLASAYRERVK